MEENQIPVNSFMSAEINEISAALSAFQGEVEQPALNKTNPYFKSRYVDLSGVLKAVQKTLAKNGLSLAQIISGDFIITLLSHKSGQWFKSVCPIGTYKNQQERGSALTYTKRYAVCAILGIAADTDDDGNSATDADKEKGGVQTTPPQNASTQYTFTGEQLKQSLADIEMAQTAEDLKAIYNKWKSIAPALVANGTEFYNRLGQKTQLIRQSVAQ